MHLYRAVSIESQGTKFGHRPTRRVPKNIPYLVDNLWELCRPETYPSRRNAVFASPTPELALAAACPVLAERSKFVVREVKILGQATIVQLRGEDAKLHRDVAVLPQLVFDCLGVEWAQMAAASRVGIAALFLPVATREEIEETLRRVKDGEALYKMIHENCTLWKDAALLHPEAGAAKYACGEVFFEALDGYTLGPPLADGSARCSSPRY